MKDILISIRKPHTDNIFGLTKNIEWRKKPLPLGHYFIYESKFINHCKDCKYRYFDCSGLGKAFDVCTFGDKARITFRSSRCWQDDLYHGGKVVGEFDIVKTYKIHVSALTFEENNFIEQGCVSVDYLVKYANGSEFLYANRIENAKVFSKPKDLSEFKTAEYHYGKIVVPPHQIKRPPQSWQYVEANNGKV